MKAPEASKDSTASDTALPARWRAALQFRNAPILLLVSLAALGTFVVTPRPTRTRIVPLPLVDASDLRAREAEEKRRAEEVDKGTLPIRTRIVGEEFRRLGASLAAGLPRFEAQTRELRADVQRLRAQGHTGELLSLRALQAELFVRAARRWDETGQADSELRELGGDFDRTAASAFLDSAGRLEVTDDQLRLIFRIRWGRLLGVHRQRDYGPSLEEFRRFYSLQIQRPEGGAALNEAMRARVQLEAVQALAALDPDYPGDLARGIVLLNAGEPDAAVESLRRYRSAHPDGPWSTIARNTLLAAATQTTPW